MRRLLIRGTNWIGDSIMTLPALREIRKHLPQTHITLMVRSWVAGIFESFDGLDILLTCDRAASTWVRFRDNRNRMREGNYDAILFFPNALGPVLEAAAAGIPRRMGYATDGRGFLLTHAARKSPRLKDRHQCFEYLDLLRVMHLTNVDYLAEGTFVPDASFCRGASFETAAQTTARKLGIPDEQCVVGIHPGASYGSAKRWFPSRFARVADLLVDSHGAHILLFGSESERPIVEAITAGMIHRATPLAGQTGLRELIHLLSRCHLVLTNDSGPMHLAAALGVPLVALFGSTNERATGPLSRKAVVVRKEVACSPCLLRECPLDLRCFAQISETEVVDRARAMLDGT